MGQRAPHRSINHVNVINTEVWFKRLLFAYPLEPYFCVDDSDMVNSLRSRSVNSMKAAWLPSSLQPRRVYITLWLAHNECHSAKMASPTHKYRLIVGRQSSKNIVNAWAVQIYL